MDTFNGVGYPAKLEILARAVPQEWFFGSMPFQYAFVSRARAPIKLHRSHQFTKETSMGLLDSISSNVIRYPAVGGREGRGRAGEGEKRDETSSTSMRNSTLILLGEHSCGSILEQLEFISEKLRERERRNIAKEN